MPAKQEKTKGGERVSVAPALMSMRDAAEYLGVSWSTLRQWVAAGVNVPCYRFPKATSPPRFKRADLDRYIERHRVDARERIRLAKRSA